MFIFPVLFIAERFLGNNLEDEWLDDLVEEWRAFQVAEDLPAFITDPPGDRPDAWWSKVIVKKDLGGHLRFGKLATLINILLILPYDQAPVERLFSMVGKIHTQYR